MITLIHGSDTYLSYKFLKEKESDLSKRFSEIKTINVDDTFEVGDATVIYGLLSEQDLFSSAKLIVLKRISSSDLFFKLGRALKTSQKLFEELKKTTHEIILWEDKKLTLENPLSKLSKEKILFESPNKDYEVSGYIQKNFPNTKIEIKKLILQGIKTTDTNEIASEIQKLENLPINLLDPNLITLTKTVPAWIISDAMLNYLVDINIVNLQKLFQSFKDFDEDIRYKLAIIQNQICDLIYAKRSSTDIKIKEQFFNGKRAWLYSKLERITGKVSITFLFDLYKKSLIVEYLLNNGLISEKVALENIFVGDLKAMNLELLG